MKQGPFLALIRLHPIKSLDGVSVAESRIGPAGGLELDRVWALSSDDGRGIDGKSTPALQLIRATFAPDISSVTLSAPTDPRAETGSGEAFIPALRLYESAGFSRCGAFDGYVEDAFAVFMTRNIKGSAGLMSTAPANPNKALWEKGDFTRIAVTMRESGDALVRRIGVTKGLKVLDLGCGDGTTALPAAQLGADVLGVDIARNLVEAGNKRAAEHGLANLTFREGDATNLQAIPDQSFDLVVSIFGAMFAPKPFDVAKEMARVTRPGGRIVMGNWIPNDPTLVAQILKISAAYTPPPPEGFISPMTWGIESNVLERFTAAGIPGANISFARDTFTFNFDGPPERFVAAFRDYYGPTMNAFAAAEANGRAADLQKELEALFTSQNTSANATSIAATFLRVTVVR